MHDLILMKRDGHIATVTLNRPDKLNAMTKPMWARLGDIMETLSGDETVRCVVLRGAGGKAFSPGNDIGEFKTTRANAEQAREYGKVLHRTLGAIKTCRHPTLAAIEGICVGGGLEIAACCDLRICGASSRFGVPIKRLGLVMAYEELEALLDLVGRSNTAEILFEGEVFGADRALAMGLVNRVVADSAVGTESDATAKRIADGAPLVARWHKRFMQRLQDPAPLTAAERDEGYHCFDTEDFQSGYQAFLAKQTPAFKGR